MNLSQYAERIRNDALANLGQGASNSGSGNALTTRGKWLQNLRAVIPEHARPSVVGADKAWRDSDAQESWQSTARSAGTQNAVRTAYDFIEDVMFRTGNVPFRCSVVGDNGQKPESLTSDQIQALEESIEQHLDGRHSKCDGPTVLMLGAHTSMIVGPRFWHVFTVPDDVEPSGERPAFETVSPWECYWDMDSDGPLEDGEFFGRMQRKSAWRLEEWAAGINAKSRKRYGNDQIDLTAMRSAIKASKNEGSNGAAMTSTDSGGTPDTDDLLHKSREEVVDELWAWVPVDSVVEWSTEHPECIQIIDSMPEENDQTKAKKRMWAMMTMVNGKLCGILPNPGKLPYRMNGWSKMPGCRDWLGIPDANSTNQKVLDGLSRALENDLKTTRTILMTRVAAWVNKSDVKQLLKEPLPHIEVNMGLAKSLNDAIQAFSIPSNADKFLKGLEFFSMSEDRDTGFPRIQQGQVNQTSDETAFALKQRLDNSGRHAGSKIRGMDSDIVWINATMLELDQQLGNYELPMDVDVRGAGFRTFTKQLSMYTALIGIMQLAKQFPEINERLQLGWALWELADAQGIDPERLWVSEAEYQKAQQARQQSPEQQAATEQMRLALAELQSKVDLNDANAQAAMAKAQATVEGIAQADAKILSERSKTAVDIAQRLREGASTKSEKRMTAMEPKQRVKKSPKPKKP